MRDTEVVPDPQLMESMRAVGYTLETAVADIIDNSITAGGDQIDIRFTVHPKPNRDRGQRLRHGPGDPDRGDEARGPAALLRREPHDLGRLASA